MIKPFEMALYILLLCNTYIFRTSYAHIYLCSALIILLLIAWLKCKRPFDFDEITNEHFYSKAIAFFSYWRVHMRADAWILTFKMQVSLIKSWTKKKAHYLYKHIVHDKCCCSARIKMSQFSFKNLNFRVIF